MMKCFSTWKYGAVLLCIYGFCVHFLPSEPFFVPYLQTPRLNISEDEVISKILPMWTYGYLIFLFPVFLTTDLLKYKPVVIMQALGWVACYFILIFGKTVLLMQIVEIVFAIGTASEVAYNSYIYSIVPKKYHQTYTAYTRSVLLLSSFVSYTTGQLLVSFANIDLRYLTVISLSFVSLALLVALFLPKPKSSSLLNHNENIENKDVETDLSGETLISKSCRVSTDIQSKCNRCRTVCKNIFSSLKKAYTDKEILLWSIWWATIFNGWIFVVNYTQSLWSFIDSDVELNGFISTLATMFGAFGSFLVKWIPLNNPIRNNVVAGLVTIFISGCLFLASFTTSIGWSYFSYVLFSFLYNYVITVTQYQLAVIQSSEIALIIGFNTFIGLLLNTIMTVILIEDSTLHLPVQTLFTVHGFYFGAIAIAFTCIGIWKSSKASSTSTTRL